MYKPVAQNSDGAPAWLAYSQWKTFGEKKYASPLSIDRAQYNHTGAFEACGPLTLYGSVYLEHHRDAVKI
jgi:hypothetical protein